MLKGGLRVHMFQGYRDRRLAHSGAGSDGLIRPRGGLEPPGISILHASRPTSARRAPARPGSRRARRTAHRTDPRPLASGNSRTPPPLPLLPIPRTTPQRRVALCRWFERVSGATGPTGTTGANGGTGVAGSAGATGPAGARGPTRATQSISLVTGGTCSVTVILLAARHARAPRRARPPACSSVAAGCRPRPVRSFWTPTAAFRAHPAAEAPGKSRSGRVPRPRSRRTRSARRDGARSRCGGHQWLLRARVQRRWSTRMLPPRLTRS